MTYNRIILIILLFFPALSFSYTPETTHAGLTENSVIFYNKNFDDKISDEQKEIIIKGSIDEDYPVYRVLNHFYDPVRNIGINNFRTAKDWVTNGFTDNLYIWSRGIELYSKGEKEEAFIYLGHILHLVQDMTVPDHTRNDPHVGNGITGLYTGESSYEAWSDKNKNRITLSGLSEFLEKEEPKIFEKLEDYFDFLANYSNGNFFGDDSIKSDVYQYDEPKILEYKNGYVYGVDKLKLTSEKLLIAKDNGLGIVSYFLNTSNDHSVLSSYFDRLSKQAILSGAGVIDLFIREGEIARTEYLKEKAKQAEIEINKAIELDKNLNNSSEIKLALFGLKSILQENVIEPTKEASSVLKDGFVFGSRLVSSGAKSAGSFLVFSSDVVVKQALANAKESIDKFIYSTKKVAVKNSEKNLANVSELAVKIPETAVTGEMVVLAESMEDSESEENSTIRDDVVQSNTDHSASLSDAYSILAELSKSLAKPLVKETPKVSTGNPYSPGFGGGETPNHTEDRPPYGDKPVDNPVEKSGINENNGQKEGFLNDSETEKVNIENTATSTFGALIEAVSSIIPDTTAPNVSLAIEECKKSLSESSCLLSGDELNIFWNSTSEDLSYFEVNINGEISTTTATSTKYITGDNVSVDFSVSAFDLSNNMSDIVKRTAKIFSRPIVINEIAWNGTAGHPEDEWIELYNRTDEKINLDDWLLYSAGDLSPYIKLQGNILPKGYYLIERRNDGEEDEEKESPIKNVPADIWVSFGSGILNTGENLILSYSSTTIDEIPLFPAWNKASNQRSFEKYDPDLLNTASNWASNNGEIMTGINVAGGSVFGTPRSRNSISYLINRNFPIILDTRLTKDKSPYYIPKNQSVIVREGSRLKIDPGVVLKFGEGSFVNVEGAIDVLGTKEEPVVFTSFKDDNYGGDFNGDGFCDIKNSSSTASCPSPGSFYGILFSEKSATSSISNSVFRYGGINYGTKKGMVYVDSAFVSISDSLFEYSGSYGVNLKNSNSFIKDVRFENNKDVSSSGLNVFGGEPEIINNIFSSNYVGVSSNSSGANIKDNTFFDNSFRSMQISGPITGIISGNNSNYVGEMKQKDFISISGSISQTNSTTTLYSNSMPYFLYGTVNVSASSTLIIKEGSSFVGTNSGSVSRLNIGGHLVVGGTKENKVVFRSDVLSSDGCGWPGIYFLPFSSSYIKGAVFKDASTAITYNQSNIVLEDVDFLNNKLGIKVGQMPSIVESAVNVYFDDKNQATTSPSGLW